MWTLHKGEHAAAIDLKAVPGIGVGIVLTVDGEWRRSRLYGSHEQAELMMYRLALGPYADGRVVTIQIPDGGPPFEAALVEDEFHMLWLVNRNRRGSGRLQILLSAALKNGCKIVNATSAERVVLEEHGFASGRVQ